MLKLMIFQGSPCCAARVTSNAVPAIARLAPIRWLMLLNRSPWYMRVSPAPVSG